MSSVVVAVPCHRDEPAVAETVRALATEVAGLDARIVVCLNGPEASASPAAASLGTLGDLPVAVSTLAIDVASKAAAWTRLRAEEADVVVFADADVSLEPGSVRALLDALASDPSVVVAAARQRPAGATTLPGRVASVPFRLRWGGLAGTLYAARRSGLPAEMPAVLLDDAWLFATVGSERVAAVDRAVAVFTPAASWRDLWRQRVRAEAGKRQLAQWGLALADPPGELRPGGILRAYPPRQLPLVVALGVVKAAAALRARLGPAPRWLPARSTKGEGVSRGRRGARRDGPA